MTDVARVASLEASCRAALPALEERAAGDWLIRLSGGDTKRVNSVNPIAPRARVKKVLESAEQYYAARSLPCRFRLTPLADADADRALAERGYASVDASFVMAAPLAPRAADPALRLADRPSAVWLDRVAPLAARAPAAEAVQRRLLANIPGPIALAMIDEGAGPIASGYVSLGAGRAQLADIVVAPAARGRGVGRRLVAGLLGWAAERGGGEALLQVLADNTPARRLYRSLGFADVYRYHYRISATAPPPPQSSPPAR